MDHETAEALADLRYQLAQIRAGLGVSTQLQAEAAIHVLNTTVAGLPWNPLTMPGGASGRAEYRKDPGGQLAVRLRLSWRSAPGTAVLYGIPESLWPPEAYDSGQGVTVSQNGTITVTTTQTAVSAHLLVPLH